MADENRTPSDALNRLDDLLAEPQAFSFFQALRRLECAHSQQPRLGEAVSPAQEGIRLGQDGSMTFAPTTVTSCAWQANPEVMRLGVAFPGLFGPHGPLPLHLTDYALERARRHKDPTFLRFADLFHHRFLSLFYRAWASAQPTVSADRPAADRFGDYIASLCGLGLPTLQQRDAMLDGAKRHFAGWLQCGAKNAEGLEAMIGAYFQVPVRIREFIGEWLEIAPRDRCRLGATPETGTLGVTAIAGTRVFECQHKFRLHLGPLGLSVFERFLPGGDGLVALIAVVRNQVGDEYAWDLQLILRHEEVPPLCLGSPTARLGWTSWLGTRPGDREADDLILNPFLAARSVA